MRKKGDIMAETKWTPDQQLVIDLRDRNILVSAAAGSGKTAVLVERIIKKVTDPEKPVDIDRLLVVTFTKAAAGEMRSRIGAALEKQLLEHPENEHLQKQISLLHNAQITTIDSFCQNIIRNYFHVIDLDPVFRVADETEIALMMSEVLKEVIERRYEKGDRAFLDFVEVFAPGRTDSAIENLILHTHRIAMSYPWPQEWIKGIVQIYQCRTLKELDQCKWVQELTGYMKEMIAGYLDLAKQARNLCMEADGPDTYLEAISSDVEQLQMLSQAKTYTEYATAFAKLNPARLSTKKTAASQERKEQVKALRDGYLKNGVQTLQKNYFFQSPEQMLEDMQAMEPVIQELIDVTMEFSETFSAAKREEGILDFNDMEHFALNILIDRSGKEPCPSDTAKELQEYYEEILTDEYQDSNFIQELILTSISRAPKEAPYLFMVGDVKQSIYQFRLARPELFNEKYNSYTVGEGPCQRIDLHQNFRSREMVLESANFLFRQMMQESLGGIVYDEAASLVPGANFGDCEERTATKSRVLLLEKEASEEEGLNKVAAEAAVIGNKIREMVLGEHPLWVKGKNGYHPLEYRDIVILLRSPGTWVEEFIEILMDMGIPAYSETKTGYFSTIEVETVLNLLRIIDNPRQDIPMVSVLRSCLAGITDEELARIATMPREINYQDGIMSYLEWYQAKKDGETEGNKEDNEEEGEVKKEADEVLYEKLSCFWDMLKRYRELSQVHSVYELLRMIYRETGYYHIMQAMPSGEKRVANLDILLQQAIEFSKKGHSGIFAFIRYIESLHKSDIDFGEASLVNENMNTVRIMSIHKSKGLEFPVVFVAGLGKQFNLQDARQGTIIDSDYGVGAEYFDLKLRVKQPTLIKKFMANRIRLNTLAEEIRILYVALTRAKELLILTGSVRGMEKKLEKWQQKGGIRSLFDLTAVTTYLDWIMPVVFSSGGNEYFEVEICNQEEIIGREAGELAAAPLRYELLKNWDTENCYDEEMQEQICRQTGFSYPYAKEGMVPVKISVSELKRLEMARLEAINEDNLWEDVKPEESFLSDSESKQERESSGKEEMPRPVFLAGEKELSGAGKGTLYHLAMEHLPYERIWQETGWEKMAVADRRMQDWDGLNQWLSELSGAGYLTEEETKVFRQDKFQTFLQTSLGQRMGDAAAAGQLYREQPFMLGIEAKELYPESESEELVLVQGIIDAWFLEGEDIVLVDYKTDSVKSGDGQELVNKYRAQLRYYAQALERLTGRRVKQQMIYSFALGEEIRVDG